MSYKHSIGLHLRIKENLTTLITEALEFGLPTFQFFLNGQKTSRYLTITQADLTTFLRLKNQLSQPLFIHSSYWINPAAGNKVSFDASKKLLSKEIRLAKKLEIPYIVLHAGSAKDYPENLDDPDNKTRGIQTLVKMLNSVLKQENDVKILFENAAHGNKTIGSDLHDFVLLKNELNAPEKINFCIDTAHAFSYGYDLEKTNDFVDLLDQTMGLNNIKLIHFNDSKENKGSKRDIHSLPGHGKIGKNILHNFINHPHLKHLPKIIECPAMSKQELEQVLENISHW